MYSHIVIMGIITADTHNGGNYGNVGNVSIKLAPMLPSVHVTVDSFRYKLLLQELVKQTDEADAEYERLTRCVQQITAIAGLSWNNCGTIIKSLTIF